MIGIMLAGGAATRLPNKPLLPQVNLQPVCFSGMEYLCRHAVSEIHVVVPSNSVIVDIIDEHFKNSTNLNFIYQAEPTGVGDALNLVKSCEGNFAMVVMADNVYPTNEVIDDVSPLVVIRDVPAWKRAHLVRWGGDGRLTRTGPGRLALTTPWIVPMHDGSTNFSHHEAWEDLQGVKRLQFDGIGWYDVGTPELYSDYWRTARPDYWRTVR